jgi:hypothetical protein
MGKIMTLRKSSLFLTALWMWAGITMSSFAAEPATKKGTPLPSLHYAGTIPVQWDKDEVWQDVSFVRDILNREFPEAVRNSHRFAMINDDLVASLWKTPAGRTELENDYELSAFVSLDVSARGDMVVLTARILSSKLETRIQESDVVPRKWLSEATREQTVARMTDLVSRMINRLPIDVHVTSVNGHYVTLSGGEEQGLKAGQKFDVLSASIDGLHPANGSWTSFKIAKTGGIEIIELKNQSAIGRMTSLTYEGSIKPGNGIRVEDISGRNRFARTEEIAPEEPESQRPAPSAQAVTSKQPAKTPQPLTNTESETPLEKPEAAPAESDANTVKQPQESAKNEPVKVDDAKNAPPPTDRFTAALMPKGSELRAWLGMRMWSISGSASASAALPVWIVNSAGADVYRKFSDTIDYNYGLDLGYGPTNGGSFFGYNLHSGGRWHMYMKDVLPGADDVYFGLLASMTSTNVSGETSDGYTLTMIRLTIGVHGWAEPGFIGDKIEWTGEFFYPLYYSGEFGVKGTSRAINSGSSTAFRLGGYLGNRPADGWQYGAGFEYESNQWSLEKKKTAEYGSIGLLALARRSL